MEKRLFCQVKPGIVETMGKKRRSAGVEIGLPAIAESRGGESTMKHRSVKSRFSELTLTRGKGIGSLGLPGGPSSELSKGMLKPWGNVESARKGK